MAAVHLPDGLQNFFNDVLDMKWPEGDEYDLSDMSDYWLDFQDALNAAKKQYEDQAKLIRRSMSGALADQLYDQYRKQIPANLQAMADTAGQMSDACLQTAAAILKAKVVFVLIAAATLAMVIELLVTVIGGLLVPAVELAARVGMLLVEREMLAKVASIAIEKTVVTLTTREGMEALGSAIERAALKGGQAAVNAGKVAIKGAPQAAKQLVVDAAKYGAFAGGMMGVADLAGDLATDIKTNKHGTHWHTGVDGQALFSSVVLGVTGGALFGAGRALSRGIDILSKDFRANLGQVLTRNMSEKSLASFTRATTAFKALGYSGLQMGIGGVATNQVTNKLQDPVAALGAKLFPDGSAQDGQPASPHAPDSPAWAGLLGMFSRAQGARAMKLRLAPLKGLDLAAFKLSDLTTVGIPDLHSANVWDLRKIGIQNIDLNDKTAPGATDLTDTQREQNRLALTQVDRGSTTIGDAVDAFLKGRGGDTSGLAGTGEQGGDTPGGAGDSGGAGGSPSVGGDGTASTVVGDRSSTWSGATARGATDGTDGTDSTDSTGGADRGGGADGAGARGDDSGGSRRPMVLGERGGRNEVSEDSSFRSAWGGIPVQRSNNALGAGFLRSTSDAAGSVISSRVLPDLPSLRPPTASATNETRSTPVSESGPALAATQPPGPMGKLSIAADSTVKASSSWSGPEPRATTSVSDSRVTTPVSDSRVSTPVTTLSAFLSRSSGPREVSNLARDGQGEGTFPSPPRDADASGNGFLSDVGSVSDMGSALDVSSVADVESASEIGSVGDEDVVGGVSSVSGLSLGSASVTLDGFLQPQVVSEGSGVGKAGGSVSFSRVGWLDIKELASGVPESVLDDPNRRKAVDDIVTRTHDLGGLVETGEYRNVLLVIAGHLSSSGHQAAHRLSLRLAGQLGTLNPDRDRGLGGAPSGVSGSRSAGPARWSSGSWTIAFRDHGAVSWHPDFSRRITGVKAEQAFAALKFFLSYNGAGIEAVPVLDGKLWLVPPREETGLGEVERQVHLNPGSKAMVFMIPGGGEPGIIRHVVWDSGKVVVKKHDGNPSTRQVRAGVTFYASLVTTDDVNVKWHALRLDAEVGAAKNKLRKIAAFRVAAYLKVAEEILSAAVDLSKVDDHHREGLLQLIADAVVHFGPDREADAAGFARKHAERLGVPASAKAGESPLDSASTGRRLEKTWTRTDPDFDNAIMLTENLRESDPGAFAVFRRRAEVIISEIHSWAELLALGLHEAVREIVTHQLHVDPGPGGSNAIQLSKNIARDLGTAGTIERLRAILELYNSDIPPDLRARAIDAVGQSHNLDLLETHETFSTTNTVKAVAVMTHRLDIHPLPLAEGFATVLGTIPNVPHTSNPLLAGITNAKDIRQRARIVEEILPEALEGDHAKYATTIARKTRGDHVFARAVESARIQLIAARSLQDSNPDTVTAYAQQISLAARLRVVITNTPARTEPALQHSAGPTSEIQESTVAQSSTIKSTINQNSPSGDHTEAMQELADRIKHLKQQLAPARPAGQEGVLSSEVLRRERWKRELKMAENEYKELGEQHQREIWTIEAAQARKTIKDSEEALDNLTESDVDQRRQLEQKIAQAKATVTRIEAAKRLLKIQYLDEYRRKLEASTEKLRRVRRKQTELDQYEAAEQYSPGGEIEEELRLKREYLKEKEIELLERVDLYELEKARPHTRKEDGAKGQRTHPRVERTTGSQLYADRKHKEKMLANEKRIKDLNRQLAELRPSDPALELPRWQILRLERLARDLAAAIDQRRLLANEKNRRDWRRWETQAKKQIKDSEQKLDDLADSDVERQGFEQKITQAKATLAEIAAERRQLTAQYEQAREEDLRAAPQHLARLQGERAELVRRDEERYSPERRLEEELELKRQYVEREIKKWTELIPTGGHGGERRGTKKLSSSSGHTGSIGNELSGDQVREDRVHADKVLAKEKRIKDLNRELAELRPSDPALELPRWQILRLKRLARELATAIAEKKLLIKEKKRRDRTRLGTWSRNRIAYYKRTLDNLPETDTDLRRDAEWEIVQADVTLIRIGQERRQEDAERKRELAARRQRSPKELRQRQKERDQLKEFQQQWAEPEQQDADRSISDDPESNRKLMKEIELKLEYLENEIRELSQLAATTGAKANRIQAGAATDRNAADGDAYDLDTLIDVDEWLGHREGDVDLDDAWAGFDDSPPPFELEPDLPRNSPQDDAGPSNWLAGDDAVVDPLLPPEELPDPSDEG